MMKINVDGVIVVEGKEDISFLSSFINSLFFITNGYDINTLKIDFLKKVSKVNKIIVLTDPDEAGETIRNKLKDNIEGIEDCRINVHPRNNYKKRGVAETHKEDIINSIKPYICDYPINIINYDLGKLSLEYPNIKQLLIKKYHLLEGNNKFIENELNMLKISKEEINEYIKECYVNR